jgi:Diacylglycerol kinase catalytic domain
VFLLLAVGLDDSRARPAQEVLSAAGDTRTVHVPTAPARKELDAALDVAAGRLLVVAGDDAALNAVVRRLLRRDRLGDVPVAFVPVGVPVGGSALCRAAGLPEDTARAAGVAAGGRARPRGLVRDDHGGVLLGRATLTPWDGDRFGARAHVDDTPVADGVVRELAVRPAEGCLTATVRRGRLRRPSGARGRAVTVGCAPARLTVDGAPHPRPQRRWTWWYEPDRWHLVVPG